MSGPATVQQRPSYPNAPTNVYYWECRECGHEGGWTEGGSTGDLRVVKALAEKHNREMHQGADQ